VQHQFEFGGVVLFACEFVAQLDDGCPQIDRVRGRLGLCGSVSTASAARLAIFLSF
jgi:hypothetical protein